MSLARPLTLSLSPYCDNLASIGERVPQANRGIGQAFGPLVHLLAIRPKGADSLKAELQTRNAELWTPSAACLLIAELAAEVVGGEVFADAGGAAFVAGENAVGGDSVLAAQGADKLGQPPHLC